MSKIEWTEKTWNPTSGCTRVSAGCDSCYAVTMTRRLAAMGQEKYKGLVNEGKKHFNGVVKTHDDALSIPLKVKKPTTWFVNSMSDLFHKEVPFDFVDKVFAVMALCPQHTFQILTKRPERMAEYFTTRTWAGVMTEIDLLGDEAPESEFERYCNAAAQFIAPSFKHLPNIWLGTSVEDQKAADERIPHLLKIPAAVRFLSCEPLLGPVTIPRFISLAADLRGDFPIGHNTIARAGLHIVSRNQYGAKSVIAENGLLLGVKPSECVDIDVDWVIVGGESGHGARPMHPDWARSLRDQCAAAGVKFHFKQWGSG